MTRATTGAAQDEVFVEEAPMSMDVLWERLRTWAAERHCPVLEAPLTAGSSAVVEYDEVPADIHENECRASWGPLLTFLSDAERIGVTALVAERRFLSDEDLAAANAVSAADPEDATPHDLAGMIAACRGRCIAVTLVAAARSLPVLLRIVVAPAWLELLERSLDEDEYFADGTAAAERIRWPADRIREVGRRLAHEQDYQQARNDAMRRGVAARVLADQQPPDGVLWDILHVAQEVFAVEIKPQLERQLADAGRRLLAQGKSRRATSIALGISEARLGRIIREQSE